MRFRLYSGSTLANPFGPARTGPQYATPTNWQGSACNGFEPNTIFVPGPAGALANYSIVVGGAVEIDSIDALDTTNERDHNTSKYETTPNMLVLRRGTTGKLELVVNEYWDNTCADNLIIATHTFNGAAQPIEIPIGAALPATDTWGGKVDEVTAIAGGDQRVKVSFKIPSVAPVGDFAFKWVVRRQGSTEVEVEKDFTDRVAILFNPWSADDSVSMTSDAQRREYVLGESGSIWTGSRTSNSARGWFYGQFKQKSFQASLQLLGGLNATDRASPIRVSRHLSRVVNSGVLEGNWSGVYTGGTDPRAWSSSEAILSQYLGSGRVKFGQCWVFAGVLNTTLRSLGIPARPLSNFLSAHERPPYDGTLEYYLDAAGRVDRTLTRDSIWNFHAWCDAWMKRPDRAGQDGWQAVDATPQELSGGAYQLGPAPHPAIKAKSGGNFDVEFVSGEVDADVGYYDPDGMGGFTLASTATDRVGFLISTKSVGAGSRDDITASYKVPEAPRPVRGGVGDLSVQFNLTELATAGDTISWSIVLMNDGANPISGTASITTDVIAYNGDYLQQFVETSAPFTLDPQAATTVSLQAHPSQYAPWYSAADTLQVIGRVTTGQGSIVEESLCFIQAPTPTIVTDQNVSALDCGGQQRQVSVSYRNPFAEPLLNGVFTLQSGGAIILNGGGDELVIPVGNLGGKQETVVNIQVAGTTVSSDFIAAFFRADGLAPADAFRPMRVACFGDADLNGNVGFTDIVSVLANFGGQGPTGDANNDGAVSFPDVVEILVRWGRVCCN